MCTAAAKFTILEQNQKVFESYITVTNGQDRF